VATGDGDALSIGGNHTIHMLRRNVGLQVLLFIIRFMDGPRDRTSPTSEFNKKTQIDALWLGGSSLQSCIVWPSARKRRSSPARLTSSRPHRKDTLKHAAVHKGSAFVEILQNCNIFNDGAWFSLTERDARSEQVIHSNTASRWSSARTATKASAANPTAILRSCP